MSHQEILFYHTSHYAFECPRTHTNCYSLRITQPQQPRHLQVLHFMSRDYKFQYLDALCLVIDVERMSARSKRVDGFRDIDCYYTRCY